MTRVLRLTTLLVLAAVATPLMVGQQTTGQNSAAPPATGFILGRTIDGSTGRAISGAQVSLNAVITATAVQQQQQQLGTNPTSLTRFPLRVISDGNGAFVF